MKIIAITGATGLVGTALSTEIARRGMRAVALPREPRAQGLEGVDAVIHLAGEPVSGRWTAEKKERIYASRVDGTRKLVAAIAAAQQKPRVLVSASAVGFYGARGDEPLFETAEPGRDFLSNVCVDWEREAAKAAHLGIRVASIRTGVVLSSRGGALAQMLPPFRAGAGGPFGSGKQFVPWIHLDDLVDLYLFAVENESASGPINGVAPDYATGARFAQALGAAIHRPAIVPAPGFALKAVLGEFAQTILASQLVIPARALDLDFSWKFRRLERAMQALFPSSRPRGALQAFRAEQIIPRPLEEVFAYFSDARNLEAITPKELHFHITSLPATMDRGAQIDYHLRMRGLPLTWRTMISDWNPPQSFTDVQLHGPYALWEHRHEFESVDGGTKVRDLIEYALPLYPFSNAALGLVRRDIERIFNHRRAALELLGSSA